MNGKKRWRVDVDVPAGEGMGFIVVSYEGIMSTSEDGAKKQVRSRLRKRGLKPYSASKRPVRACRIYTPLEKLQGEAIKVCHSIKSRISFYDISNIIRRSGSKEAMRTGITRQLDTYQKPLAELREAFDTFFGSRSDEESLLIEKSQDYGTTIQSLVKMCIEPIQTTEELKTLLTTRLEGLADQCYEMIDRI